MNELRAELLRRSGLDQAARRTTDWDAIRAVDAENLPWLKHVIAEVGWPGKSIAGEDGANAAWLLVQHADQDPVFQRQCLDLLTESADGDEATALQVAYLTDRVLLHEGQPQEFGTQAIGRDGKWVPRLLRDPEGVDERRARVGLGPLDEYLDDMLAHYGPPTAPRPAADQPTGGEAGIGRPD
jgi:hypothetical protein